MAREVTMTVKQDDTPPAAIAVREGLSWSWSLDLDALVAALSEPAPWNHLPPPAARPATPAAGTDADPAPVGPAEPDASDTAPANTEPANTEPANTAPSPDPVEADFADYLEAVDAGRTSVVP